ncbi:MAG TPA: right-handed parallel beta-helix repeat-containing protein [Armatimonadota bacterium]|nr:right-handed parallel beta-helix repeat-containing protein [Armatimonadota bacterium]
MIGRAAFVLAAALASCMAAGASTWYVSADGDDAADGTAWERAFGTISRGVEMLGPGDTLLVGPGVWHEQVFIEKSGTPEAPITIRAALPGRTELVGSVRLEDWRPVEGMPRVFSAPLDQTTCLVYEKDTDTEYTEVANLTTLQREPGSFLYEPDQRMIYAHPSDDAGMAHHVVDACVLDYGLASLTVTPPQKHEPRRVGLVIEGFVVRDYNMYGIYIRNADYCHIRECVAHHCRRGIFTNSSLRSSITGCEAFSCADRFNREQGDIGMMSYVFECLLESNIVHDTRQYGIRFYGGHYGNIMRGNLAWNCHTAIHIKGAIYDHVQASNLARFSDGGEPKLTPDANLVFEGNVSHRSGTSGLIPSDSVYRHNTGDLVVVGGTVEKRANLEFLPEEEDAQGFVAPDWHDLRLQSDSPHRAAAGGEDAGAYAHAGDVFFVSPTGDDAGAGTSVASAWRTLAHACRQLRAGQTLYLLPGTYAEPLELRGLQADGKPTIVRARTKGEATLDGTGITVAQCRNVRIEGMRVRNAPGPAVAVSDSPGVRIAENEVFDSAGECVRVTGASEDLALIANTIVLNSGAGVSVAAGATRAWITGNIIRDNAVQLVLPDGAPGDLCSDCNDLGGRGMLARLGERTAATLDQWRDLSGLDARSVDLAPGFVDADARDLRLSLTSLCRGRGYLDRPIGSGRVEPAPGQEIRFEDVEVVNAGSTSADLAWTTTGGPATILVAWGTAEGALGNLLVRDTGYYFRSRHLVTLTGLQPGTRYFFQVGRRVLLDGPEPYHSFRYAWPERGPQGEQEYYESLPRQDTFDDRVVSFTTPARDTVSANVYHVSPAGDDGAPGSADRPLRTIAKACELARPGDRVIVHEGVYYETIRPVCSGLPGHPISFEAPEGERVVLDGRRELTPHGADLLERHHIIIRGFFFAGQSEFARYEAGGGQVYLVRSSDITIERCVFDGRMNYVTAIWLAWCRDVTVHNNIFVNHHGTIVAHDTEGTLTLTRNSFLGPTIFKLYAPRSENLVVRDNLFGENLFPKKKEQYKLKLTLTGAMDEDYNCYFFDPANDIRAIIDCTPPGADLTKITSLPEQQKPGEVTRYGVRGDLTLWRQAMGQGMHSVLADPKWVNPKLIESLRSRPVDWPNRFFDYSPFDRADVALAPDSPCIGAGEGGVNIGADY